MNEKMVEKWLPLPEADLHAALEMSFRGMAAKYKGEFHTVYGQEPIKIGVGTTLLRNLHPWPARRPTSLARLLTLASVLPSTVTEEEFRRLSGLAYVAQLAKQEILPTLLHVNPMRNEIGEILKDQYGRDLSSFCVIDPMAGGGSIPLESLRLGFNTIAMEYNPVAYLILKATLEYPAKYGSQLYNDVKEEAEKLIAWARENLSKYYAEDALNHIIARGYQCPICKGIVPIIHSEKLGKNGPYINILVDRSKKKFGISVSDTPQGFEKLRCIYCETGTPLDVESVLSYWTKKHKRLLEVAFSGDVEKAKSELKELNETHMLLIKQTREGFKPCDEVDREAFERAYLDLTAQIGELRDYIPEAPIPKENDVFAPIREAGIEYWFQLFNPRQLLILTKLLKYVSERGEELTEQKGEHGAAISTYLAFGIDKLADYNNIATRWHPSRKVMDRLIGHYEQNREIDLGLEYCEAKRIDLALKWVFEPKVEKPTATRGGICPVLKQLCEWLSGLGDRIYVLMADARDLHRILGENVAHVINVDPPYLKQHYYADFSEFFWQLLRISLKHAIEAGLLFNRDENKGRVELLVEGWSPLLSTVPREGEIISRRDRGSPDVRHTKEWYVEQMWRFFSSAYRVLEEDGVLLLWFTHSDPEAWAGILSALHGAGFTVSKVWTVRTEMAERRVAQKGPVFFSSLAIVARKGVERIVTGLWAPEKLIVSKPVKDIIIKSLVDAYGSALNSKADGFELLVMSLAGAIAGATKIRNPEFEVVKTVQTTLSGEPESELELKRFRRMSVFFKDHLYPAALYIGSEWLLYKAMEEAGFKDEFIREVIASDRETVAYLLLWEAATYVGELEVDYDFAEKISKVVGVSVGGLQRYELVKKEKGVRLLLGRQMFEEAKGRLEVLGNSVAGRASILIDSIITSPLRGDPAKTADFIVSKIPVGKRDALVALFQLKTGKDEWLKRVGIEQLLKPFVEETLNKLIER